MNKFKPNKFNNFFGDMLNFSKIFSVKSFDMPHILSNNLSGSIFYRAKFGGKRVK